MSSNPRKSLNQILAQQLRALLAERQMTDVALAKLAKVSPNTIGNYKKSAGQVTSTGKERSAKLTEVERIAAALGVHPLFLLTDPEEAAARAVKIAEAIIAQGGTTPASVPAPAKPQRLAA